MAAEVRGQNNTMNMPSAHKIREQLQDASAMEMYGGTSQACRVGQRSMMQTPGGKRSSGSWGESAELNENDMSAAQTPKVSLTRGDASASSSPPPHGSQQSEDHHSAVQLEQLPAQQHVGLFHSGLEDRMRMRVHPPLQSDSLWGEKVGVMFIDMADPHSGNSIIINGQVAYAPVILHGMHEVQDRNGTVINGFWKDNYMHGPGKLKFKSGASFDGEFKDGLMDGQGRWIGARGEWYEGAWCIGYTHGPGLFRWPDGSTYHGDWHWGLMWGNGKFTQRSGDMTEYSGQFANGQRHGNGRIKYPNGDTHYCIWYFDQKWITFNQTYANGDVYSRNGATKFALDNEEEIDNSNCLSYSPLGGVNTLKRRMSMNGAIMNQAPLVLEQPEKPPPPPRPQATLTGCQLVRCNITSAPPI